MKKIPKGEYVTPKVIVVSLTSHVHILSASSSKTYDSSGSNVENPFDVNTEEDI